jgi:hypothetical protein
MEYLMTYGWALLIIAVVLVALFSLGVFSGSSLLGTSCVASPGYLCSSPTLLTTGGLSFTFGQNTGTQIYNIEMACTATSTSSGYPNPITAWQVISGNAAIAGTGVAINNANVANALTLVSGQTQAINSLPCYSSTGTSLSGATIGTTFSGFIWLNYTTSACAPPGTPCTWYTVKAATATLKVV